MRKLILTLLVTGTLVAAPGAKKTTAKKQTGADKTADRILAATEDPLLVKKWYNDVLPSLKRKYKKSISRRTYDAWRRQFFKDEVIPVVMQAGANLATAEDAFLKLTANQLRPPHEE